MRGAADARIRGEVGAGVQAVAPAVEVSENLVRRARIDELAAVGLRGGVDRLVEVELLGRGQAVAAEVAVVLDLDLDATQTFGLVSTLSFVAAGLAAATGGALWYWSSRSAQQDARACIRSLDMCVRAF